LLCCLLWILLIWSKEVIKGFHLRIQLWIQKERKYLLTNFFRIL
jgi:hypothetical protein